MYEFPIVYKNFDQKKSYIEYNPDPRWDLDCDYADAAFRKAREAKEKIGFWFESTSVSVIDQQDSDGSVMYHANLVFLIEKTKICWSLSQFWQK